MEQKAIEILDQNRLMALATIRADGWPQNTMVGYANDGLLLYFVVSRQSQKFANIQKDDRVSLVVGRDFTTPRQSRHCRLQPEPRKSPRRSSATRRSDCFSSVIPASPDLSGRRRGTLP